MYIYQHVDISTIHAHKVVVTVSKRPLYSLPCQYEQCYNSGLGQMHHNLLAELRGYLRQSRPKSLGPPLAIAARSM